MRESGPQFEAEAQYNRERAWKSLERHGYQADEKVAPYKSFGERERFFIQRASDATGRDVVVKISAPEQAPSTALHNEERIIRAIDAAYNRATEEGKEAMLEVPVLVDAWEDGKARGIVTEFVQDDKEAKRNLSGEDRSRVLRQVIDGLHALEVPPELEETGQRPLDGAAHAERAERFVKNAGDTLDAETGAQVIKLFQDNAELLNRLPLKLAHGDLHGENLAYRKDEQGSEHVTIMDLELLRINNEYYDWATTANLSTFSRIVSEHPKEFGPILERMKDSWFDENSLLLEDFIEQEVIAKDPRGVDAETAYRLMRIQHALGKLSKDKGNDPLTILSREGALRIIKEQLKKL